MTSRGDDEGTFPAIDAMYLRDKENLKKFCYFPEKAEKPQWILIMLLFSWGLPSLHRWILDVPFLEGGFLLPRLIFFRSSHQTKQIGGSPVILWAIHRRPAGPHWLALQGRAPAGLRTSLSTGDIDLVMNLIWCHKVWLSRTCYFTSSDYSWIEGTVIISLSLSRSGDCVSCCVIVFNIETLVCLWARIRKSTLSCAGKLL